MLAWIARHGRVALVLGLVAGTALPALARAMEPLIVPLIAALLLLAALRVGPAALPAPRAWPRHLALAVGLQAVPPLLALGLLHAAGHPGGPVATGVVLALAASPITGSPGLAILSGADPAPALRQLAIGTALLPLTALPTLALLPVFESPADALLAAGRLLALIVLAGGGGLALRRAAPGLAQPGALARLDGLMALAMAAVVVALMAAVGPALLSGEGTLWRLLALVGALNFGTQIAVWALARRLGAGPAAPSLAIVAGNRNLALFLGAMPPETAQALLLFVGCFQVPMYLTPLVMAPLYRRTP